MIAGSLLAAALWVFAHPLISTALYMTVGLGLWHVTVTRQIERDAALGDPYAIVHMQDAYSGALSLWLVCATAVLLWPLLLAYGLLVYVATCCTALAAPQDKHDRDAASR